MPASPRVVSEINLLINNGQAIDFAAVIAAGAGIVATFKHFGIWHKFTPVEQHELELEDEDRPENLLKTAGELATASFMSGKKPRFKWHHNRQWSLNVSDNAIDLGTPIYDEEKDELV